MLISSTQTSFSLLHAQKGPYSVEEGEGVSSALVATDKVADTLETKNTDKGRELSAGERLQVTKLQQRDSEVRSHEAAHIAAGGSVVTGAANFTYQKGPDGKLYAIGGEVAISSSGGSTPEEKIAIAKKIRAGALAPANPSPQDIKVASSAAMMEAMARQELSQEHSELLKQKALKAYSSNQDIDA
jgi:hypothetical protein